MRLRSSGVSRWLENVKSAPRAVAGAELPHAATATARAHTTGLSIAAE